MVRPQTVWMATALLALPACTTEEPAPVPARVACPAHPCIRVEPKRIEFPSVSVSAEAPVPEEVQVTVSNVCDCDVGDTALELRGVEVSGNTSRGLFSVANLDEVILGEGEEATFTASFAPRTAGDFTGRIVVTSNDPDAPESIIRLGGTGLASQLVLSPDGFDYGRPYIGCEQEQVLTIINAGNVDLLVDDVQLLKRSPEYELDLREADNGELPFTLAPYDAPQYGPTAEVQVSYLPLDTLSDGAVLMLSSNDPFSPKATASFDGIGTKYLDQTDVFEQPFRTATDVLVVHDPSRSMADYNLAFTGRFGSLFGTLQSLDADFHVAAVSDDVGCVVGPYGHVDGSFSPAAAVDAYAAMVHTGAEPGNNARRGFLMAEAALSPRNLGLRGCNEAFYRDEAVLSMVYLSDRPDQSVRAWSYYVEQFQNLKADPGDVVVSAMAGDLPDGCEEAEPGAGYYEATTATGGRFLSICTTDWNKALEDLAVVSSPIKPSFELTVRPVPQTVRVRVDGVSVLTGWAYDLAANAVVFDEGSVPVGGSQIEVRYERQPECDG